MKEDMDLPPRKIVLLTHFGLAQPVKDSKTVWICASCHKCEALCPRGIDLPKVMEAVRQIMLRDNVDYVELKDIPEDTKLNAPQVAFVSCYRKLTA